MRLVRHAVALIAAIALNLACDAVVLVRDPGDLEVHNWLRGDLIAWVSGRPHPVLACSILELSGVELRGIRVTTGSGLDLLEPDTPASPPIGPRRFVLVGGPFVGNVADLRTRPNTPRPEAPECTQTVEDWLHGGAPGAG